MALAAAVLLRWLLDPLMGDALPLVTLFGAVAVAVWVGGYRPAIVVAILGYVACAYLFIHPRGHLGLDRAATSSGWWPISSPVPSSSDSARRCGLPGRERARQREVLRVTLRSIGDAVITTDINGRVTI